CTEQKNKKPPPAPAVETSLPKARVLAVISEIQSFALTDDECTEQKNKKPPPAPAVETSLPKARVLAVISEIQ
ncbi:hypothetical protein VS883_28595, partial [Escherichia coli]